MACHSTPDQLEATRKTHALTTKAMLDGAPKCAVRYCTDSPRRIQITGKWHNCCEPHRYSNVDLPLLCKKCQAQFNGAQWKRICLDCYRKKCEINRAADSIHADTLAIVNNHFRDVRAQYLIKNQKASTEQLDLVDDLCAEFL